MMNAILILLMISLAWLDRKLIRRIEELKEEVAEIRRRSNDIY